MKLLPIVITLSGFVGFTSCRTAVLNLQTWTTLFSDCWLVYMRTQSMQKRIDLTGISTPVSVVDKTIYFDPRATNKTLLFFYQLQIKGVPAPEPSGFLYFQKITRCRAFLLDYYSERGNLPVYRPIEVTSVSKTYLCLFTDFAGVAASRFSRTVKDQVIKSNSDLFTTRMQVEYRWILYVRPRWSKVTRGSNQRMSLSNWNIVHTYVYSAQCAYCIKRITANPRRLMAKVPLGLQNIQIQSYRNEIEEALEMMERYSFIMIYSSRPLNEQEFEGSGRDLFTKRSALGHTHFMFSLVQDWLKGRNGTAVFNNFEFFRKTQGWNLINSVTHNFGFANLRYDTSTVRDWNVVVTGSDGIQFLTCDGQRESLNFAIYLEPFQAAVWLAIALCSLAVSLVLVLGSSVQNVDDLVSAIAVPLLVLIEVFGTNLAKFVRSRVLNVILAAWLVASVIFTNSYKGILTADLYRPRPVTGFVNYSELYANNFTFLHEIPEDLLHIKWYNWSLARRNREIQRLYNQKGSLTRSKSQVAPFGKLLIDMLLAPIFFADWGFLRNWYVANNLVRNMQIPLTYPETSVEQEVCKCNQTAFIAYSSSLLDFEVPEDTRLTYTGNFFSVGEEVLRFPLGWVSDEPVKGLTMRFVTHVVETGLHRWTRDRFRSLAESRFSLRRINATSEIFKPIRWKSNFNLSFWLLICTLCLGCVFLLLVEVLFGTCLEIVVTEL